MSGLHIEHKTDFHIVRWTIAIIFVIIALATFYFGIRWYSTGMLPPIPLPIASADPSVDDTAVSDAQRASYSVQPTAIRYIEIPSLDISQVRVVPVSKTTNNMIAMPKNIHDAGWYTKSADVASNAGAIVINGQHKGLKTNGVFAKLHELRKGDSVELILGDNSHHLYRIADVKETSLTSLVNSGMKEVLYSADTTKQGLNIVTNAGSWVPKLGVYDKQLIVRATAE